MTGFAKHHDSPARAAEALRRSRVLRAQGVATPEAWRGAAPGAVIFARIEGGSGPGIVTLPLADLLAPLLALQRAVVPGLPAYDPALRIRPRLEGAVPPAIARALDRPVPTGAATLHGDFHLGQLVASPGGEVWIVDLDDMALGPAEADLANFVAHLATSAWAGPSFRGRLDHWRAAVPAAWRALGGACDAARFARLLRLALIRRHLKLRGAGRPDFAAEVLGVLSAVAPRTSPSGSAACRG